MRDELPRATPTIQLAVDELQKNEKVEVTNICYSYGGINEKDHAACAAVDISKRLLDDPHGALEWLESLDLECMSVWNYETTEAPIDAKGSHFHCTDKWWGVSTSHFEPLESPVSDETDEKVSTPQVELIGADSAKNDLIQYAYEKSGYNKDLILTFTGENVGWNWDTISTFSGVGGYRAYGICQLYYPYHRDYIFANEWNGEYSEEFKNPYNQVDRCIEMWKKAEDKGILETTWYAYNTRSKWERLFNFN